MNCKECEFQNPASARFCGNCGKPLSDNKSGFLVWLVTSETPGWKGKAIIALKLLGAFYAFLFILGILVSGGF